MLEPVRDTRVCLADRRVRVMLVVLAPGDDGENGMLQWRFLRTAWPLRRLPSETSHRQRPSSGEVPEPTAPNGRSATMIQRAVRSKRVTVIAAALAATLAGSTGIAAADPTGAIEGGTSNAAWTAGHVDNMTVNFDICGSDGANTCSWSAEAAVIPASTGCPQSWLDAPSGSTFWGSGNQTANGTVSSGPRDFTMNGAQGQRVCLWHVRKFTDSGQYVSRLLASKLLAEEAPPPSRPAPPPAESPPTESSTPAAAPPGSVRDFVPEGYRWCGYRNFNTGEWTLGEPEPGVMFRVFARGMTCRDARRAAMRVNFSSRPPHRPSRPGYRCSALVKRHEYSDTRCIAKSGKPRRFRFQSGS